MLSAEAAPGSVLTVRPPEIVVDLELLRNYHAGQHAAGIADCKVVTDTYLATLRPPASVAEDEARRQEIADRLAIGYNAGPNTTIDEHISSMWDVLRRPGNSSEIHVANDVFIPGERFTENYYWDNLEVMRGLAVEGRWQDIRGMVHNYADLIETFGYIPNGTRGYFLGRSQPPVFAEMVELLAEHDGDEALVRFLPAMQREHDFWMAGAEDLDPGAEEPQEYRRVVRLPDGKGGSMLVNRFYSDATGPRLELICKDEATIALAQQILGADPEQVALDLRAACESGWDFSSRWLADRRNLYSICTTSIIPVDLNCNLLKLEQTIAQALEIRAASRFGKHRRADLEQAAAFSQRADDRAVAIQSLCWDEAAGFFFDYNFKPRQADEQPGHTGVWSLAGVYPLDMGIATPGQAQRVLGHITDKFLQPGGCMATLEDTDQQWDGRNGWAPLQYRVARAAWRNHGSTLAIEVRNRFMRACQEVFSLQRKLVEKVDVMHVGNMGDEGEYACQSGFGWTNGVYRALQHYTFTGRASRLAKEASRQKVFGFNIGRRAGALAARFARPIVSGAAGS